MEARGWLPCSGYGSRSKLAIPMFLVAAQLRKAEIDTLQASAK
jgi:hypothetical protein